MFTHFLLSNWYWVAAAVVSGIGLLFLLFQEGHYHFSVSPSEAVLMFNHHHAVFFDLRSDDVYKNGTIQHAQRVSDPRTLLETVKALSKGRSAIVFCQSGREAISVVTRLRREGADQAFALQGGVDQWLRASLPLTGAKKGE